MNLTQFLLRSRGPLNLAKRLPTIFQRFGVTPNRIEDCLNRFLALTDAYGVHPTLPVTAAPLKRHPGPIQRLQERGVELALHGLVHTDYTQLSYQEHYQHLSLAAQAFRDNGIEYFGTRAPYMRSHNITLEVARDLNLLWDSNDVVHWNVVDDFPQNKDAAKAYQKVLELYSAEVAETRTVVPYPTHGLIEIPVSLPDDEALVDRLGWGQNNARLATVWERILERIYERGELYTIQLHHERVPQLSLALENTLKTARSLRPHVWIATLREIAEWWREKAAFEVQCHPLAENKWKLVPQASSRARLQVRFRGQWQSASQEGLTVESRCQPILGITHETHPSISEWLSGEGIPHRRVSKEEETPHTLHEPQATGRRREKEILDSLENIQEPWVRFERWPQGARAALSVTGDIDSLTLIDFFLRFREV